ncbi:MAG: right-handed parallel beta-helix repeat-containing protein, partial [Thermoflavifilum sp.]|nr:right-handed parallel beta-helix repeat-containing protein [Thermoflavifilum sp.]
MKYGLLMILFMFLLGNSRAAQIRVCASCKVQTIDKALELAKPYDTLLLIGTFRIDSAYVIAKPIYIIGQNAVLDGQGKTGFWKIHTHDVHIRDLIMQHTGMSYVEDRAAIAITNSRKIDIVRVSVFQSYFGIYAYQSKHITIQDCVFDGSGTNEFNAANGIHLWYCDSVLLRHNLITHHRDGIYLEFTNNSYIEQNISRNNIRYGMHFMFSNRDQYIHNTFQWNGAGVAVMYSHDITMRENRFIHNYGANAYGLLLKEIHDSKIGFNHFEHNTVGIFMEECSRLSITDNTFLS